jgi:hypothetical protein
MPVDECTVVEAEAFLIQMYGIIELSFGLYHLKIYFFKLPPNNPPEIV